MPDRRSEKGQALVEFALILPVLLLLILGLFDVARAVLQENTLAFAAREGARYAIVHGSNSGDTGKVECLDAAGKIVYTCENATLTSVVQDKAIGVPNVAVTVSYPDLVYDRGYRVAVDATAPFVPLPSQWLFNGALSITLRGGSVLVMQW